jgi:hypothetical protein
MEMTPEQIERVRDRQKADEAFQGVFGPNRGLQAHYDRAALLRALDEALAELDKEQVSHLKTRAKLTRIREAASDPVLIDGDERTTVRIFTPYEPATRAQGESS